MSDTAPGMPDDPPDDTLVGTHYQLCAYICADTGVVQYPFGSTHATFTEIFTRRPENCRYAVGRLVPITMSGGVVVCSDEPAGPFVVWDLFDEELVRGKRTSPRGWLMPPPPRWLGDNEDGMIMKAVALYGET